MDKLCKLSPKKITKRQKVENNRRMKKLRVLLYETSENPFLNLAFEEAFVRARAAELIEDDTLRIWRNKNAVIIGYFQVPEEEVHLDKAKELGVSIVRRFTGGGAVYHDLGNLNYALVIRPKNKIKNPISYLYRNVLRGTLITLQRIGLKAYVENESDVVVNDRKISGNAASIKWNTLFLHGTLLVNADLTKLSSVLKISERKFKNKKINPVKYRVTTIANVLGSSISLKEVIEALICSYEEVLSAEAYFDVPSKEELEVAYLLYKEKYSTHKWNMERPSTFEYKELEEKLKEILSS